MRNAYLYDPQEQLPANLNAEMVDLEELDDDDVEWLRGMQSPTGG